MGEIYRGDVVSAARADEPRVVDRLAAVQFLVRVKELVEDPETLLLEG